jgi:histidine triad (HIT) family protein
MTGGGDTIFGKIIRREIPAQIVYETDNVLAFRDINPQAPVHILVIPKKPIPSVAALSPEDSALMGEVLLAAAEIANREGLAEGGYRVVTNIGHDGGQTVPHLHFHLLGGRPMLWPPG